MQSIGKFWTTISTSNVSFGFWNLANILVKNSEQHQIHFGHSQHVAVLTRQLQNAHEEKDREITTTLTRVSAQEQAMLKANR